MFQHPHPGYTGYQAVFTKLESELATSEVGHREGCTLYNTLGNTVTFSGTKVFLSVTELLKALLVV